MIEKTIIIELLKYETVVAIHTKTRTLILESIPLINHAIDSIPSTILAAVCDGV